MRTIEDARRRVANRVPQGTNLWACAVRSVHRPVGAGYLVYLGIQAIRHRHDFGADSQGPDPQRSLGASLCAKVSSWVSRTRSRSSSSRLFCPSPLTGARDSSGCRCFCSASSLFDRPRVRHRVGCARRPPAHLARPLPATRRVARDARWCLDDRARRLGRLHREPLQVAVPRLPGHVSSSQSARGSSWRLRVSVMEPFYVHAAGDGVCR